MAVAEIRPDWTIGALNLTSGSTAFTTTGSMLQTAAIQPGDELITESGLVLIIASISGQNAGTLMEPCPAGAAGAGQALRVRFQPDGSRYNGAAAELVQLLSSGNVYEFAGLVGESGKVPVFTGPGTMALGDAYSDPSGSLAKLAALTLAARQILQTDESGALKAVTLAESKALVTNAAKDVEQIDLGSLGRALLALSNGTSAQYIRADGTVQTLNASAVGLGNVNNTSDAAKPVSTATQTALNLKANTAGPTLTGQTTINELRVGIGTQQARIGFNNNNGVYVAQMGPGVGTGDANKVGFYSSVNAGWWFDGTVQVTGTLSKGGGTFLIDHPKDPFNKNLRHGFVESTEYVNIYRGMVDLVDGRMTVDIDAAFGMTDGTFAALNADVMVSSLQNQYGPDRVWVEGPAASGKFTIVCEDTESIATIAWMVTGRRNDAFVRSDLDPNTDSEGRFIPEFDKEDA